MNALIAAPILITLTLLVSGAAKLPERTATVDAMTSLRIPFTRLHPLAAITVPAAEILAAIALWIPWVPLQIVTAITVTALLIAYLVIIARALSFGEAVHCSCFGTLGSPTVSRATLGRNVLLVVLGVLTVIAAATGAIRTAVLDTPLPLLAWAVALLAALALAVLAMGGLRPAAAASSAEGAGASAPSAPHNPSLETEETDEELLDYEPVRIPFGQLQRPDGSFVTLREMAREQAVLLIILSQGCGPCVRVLKQVASWRERLEPLMRVEVAFMQPHDMLLEETMELCGPEPLHDVRSNVQKVLDALGTPMAVLLGADGMLAGGPVTDADRVEEFSAQIIEQIQEAIAAGDLTPTPEDSP